MSLNMRYMQASGLLKSGVISLGGVTGNWLAGRLRNVSSFMAIGAWIRENGGARPVLMNDRYSMFQVGVERLSKASLPLYLEFGVYQGVSLRWWSDNLATPTARLIGFDSFEGLPHDWSTTGTMAKGSFTTKVPSVDDFRVELVAGWFEDTLPTFRVPDHDALFVTLDADLYSSTASVLSSIDSLLVPGTLIYFDEFPEGEFDALRDWCSARAKHARPLAHDPTRRAWLVEVVE